VVVGARDVRCGYRAPYAKSFPRSRACDQNVKWWRFIGMKSQARLMASGFIVLLLLGVGVWMWKSERKAFAPPINTRRNEVVENKAPEVVLATYEKTFKCSIYYTPLETGFTPERGFELDLETRPGLEGRKYPRDFLRAVELEGFGHLKEPSGEKYYLRYSGGKWGFAEQPIDNHQHPLVPKHSCAISKPHALVTENAKLSIRCDRLPMDFNNLRWQVTDTGSGLEARQLDLYWGEDDPLGPGKKLSRPHGFEGELTNPTIMVLASTGTR
jgi:hypothetical protein